MIQQITISAPHGSAHEAQFNLLTHPVRQFLSSRLFLDAGGIEAVHIILLAAPEEASSRLVTKKAIRVDCYVDLPSILSLEPSIRQIRICEIILSGLRIVASTFKFDWLEEEFLYAYQEFLTMGASYRDHLLQPLSSPKNDHFGTCTCDWSDSSLDLFAIVSTTAGILVRKEHLLRAPAWNSLVVQSLSHRWKNNKVYRITGSGMYHWTAEVSSDASVLPVIVTSGGTMP